MVIAAFDKVEIVHSFVPRLRQKKKQEQKMNLISLGTNHVPVAHKVDNAIHWINRHIKRKMQVVSLKIPTG